MGDNMKKVLIFICICSLAACFNSVKDTYTPVKHNLSTKEQTKLNEQLFAAADQNNLEGIKSALAAGADINAVSIPPCEGGACGEGQTTLMMISSYYNSAETIRFLLEKGADVNAKGQYGVTALMKAAEGGRSENVKLLLEAGADVNAKDDAAETALVYAKERGYLEIVYILKQAGAKI